MIISMTREYSKLVEEMKRWNGNQIMVKDLDLDLFLIDLEDSYNVKLKENEKAQIRSLFKGRSRCSIEELIDISDMVYQMSEN